MGEKKQTANKGYQAIDAGVAAMLLGLSGSRIGRRVLRRTVRGLGSTLHLSRAAPPQLPLGPPHCARAWRRGEIDFLLERCGNGCERDRSHTARRG